MIERPKFLPTFLGALKEEAEDEGMLAIIPAYFIAFAAIGGTIAWRVPPSFWGDANLGSLTTLYGGVLTFNGLVLTLGWSAFSRVHDIIISKDIGAYIHKNGFLKDYLLQISYMHISQVMAAIFSGIGLATIVLEFKVAWVDVAVFASCITFTMYGLKQALDSVTMMNDLVWQAMTFDADEKSEDKGGLHAINGGKGD